MLKTLGEKEKSEWHNHLAKLAFAYNATVHSSTGFSPHFLLFGRSPRLPVDDVFGIENETPLAEKTYEQFTQKWKDSINQAFEIAKQHQDKANQQNKRLYDKKTRGAELVVGDRVLTRNRDKGGTGKTRSFW